MFRFGRRSTPRSGVIEHPAVATLLAAQHGVVSSRQLEAVGVSRRAMGYARERGAFVAVLPGVLRSGAHPESFESRAMAVQLHVEPDGVLSGPTAGRLLGLRGMPIGTIVAAVVRRRRNSLPGWVSVNRCSWLDLDTDVRQAGSFRVLKPLPMLLTLAASFNDHRFERAAEDVWHHGLATPLDAVAYLDLIRGEGRSGVARFERWLERAVTRARPSQSGLEHDLLTAIRRCGLPEPVRQHPVHLPSGELIHLDLAWPEVLLGVEPGHSWWHGGDLKMRADMARDRACGQLGWHIVRYDESLRSDLVGVGRELQTIYRQRAKVTSEQDRGRL